MRFKPLLTAAMILLAGLTLRGIISTPARPVLFHGAEPPIDPLSSSDQSNPWQQLQDASQRAMKNDPAKAEQLCRQAIAMAAKFPPADVRLSHSQIQLGEILRWENKPGPAEQAFKDAISSCEKAAGPNNVAMVDPLESLANFYSSPTPKLDEMSSLNRRILMIVEQQPSPDQREIARRARNLADIEIQRGRPDVADPLYQTALAAAEHHADELPYYLLNAADFYRAWGKYDQAESIARRVLSLREQSAAAPGQTDPQDAQLDLSIALMCLGNVELAAGRPQQAEPLYSRAVAIVEKINGPESLDVAPGLTALASALSAEQRYEEAAQQFKKALALTEKGVGPNAPEVADVLEKYAATLNAMHQPDAAKTQLDRAAAIRASSKSPANS